MSKLFGPREVQKILRNLMTSQKHFFAEKSPKLTIVCFHGQSVEHGQSDDSKFGIEMPDMCGHVTGRSKFLNDFLAQNKELRSQRGARMPFVHVLFYPLGPQLIPITTKTGTEVEDYKPPGLESNRIGEN